MAIANNDVAFVAWRYTQKMPGCLGFAIHRTNLTTQQTEVLPAWVGFAGQSNQNWQPKTTDVWPVQKFNWRDLTAQHGNSYEYEIIPMVGTPGQLKPLSDQSLKTNRVDLTPALGHISAYFNRGILSTQALAHQLPEGPSAGPDYKSLEQHIDKPGDPLRVSLAGQMIEALSSLLKRAGADGGQCYCALYELNDPELLDLLIGCSYAHVILSNTGPNDETNQTSREKLHQSGVDVVDRMLKEDHIGHNKFVVYVDKNQQPQAVLTGSTNWTDTALCGQSNNCIVIESPEMAAVYLDYWKRIKEDGAAQGAEYRTANNQVHQVKVDGSQVDIWFSPNTSRQTKPSQNPPEPSDLKDLFDLVGGAQSGILFLVFQPGAPSIMDKVLECQEQNLNLFIRGAATDPKAVENYDVELYHHTGEQPDCVVAASAINDQFSYWHKELLKSSPGAHAIIHDKIVVVDPFSPNCAVITGSHNLGYKASYCNDENLLIIRGDQALAAAYAVHIMDVYDHYRWRYTLQEKGHQAWSGLATSDTWQDKYFASKVVQNEVQFWTP